MNAMTRKRACQVTVLRRWVLAPLSSLLLLLLPMSAGATIAVSTLTLTGQVPAEAPGVTSVSADGRSFPVGADRSFSIEVTVPVGASAVEFDLVAADGGREYRRHVAMTLTDRGPPIDGLDVSAAELQSHLGGHGGILTWVDTSGRIQLLDFRGANPQVRALSTDVACVNPIISPDGTRIVYSVGNPNGAKQIFVRNIAGGPAQSIGTGDVGYWHFGAGGEYIIYSDWSPKADNGTGGNTYQQKLTTGGTALSGARVTIHNQAMDGGCNATLTWLGQVYDLASAYSITSATAYPMSRFYLMDGTVADHQTCNGSMAPDDSARLMLLVIPHDWVRIYTYASAADRFEETSRFLLPPRMTEWEFPEWSTHPDFATAVLRSGGMNLRLYVARISAGEGVPDLVAVTTWDTSVSYSHLYVEP